MAVAAAVPLVEAAIAAAPNVLAAASMASELAEKFGPKVKGAVNHLFRLGRKKRSAAAYLRKLGTKKGLKHFITRDIGKGLRAGGKSIAHIGAYANEVSNMTNQGNVGGAVGAHAHKMAKIVGGGANRATRYHEIAEGYNDHVQDMVTPLRKYRV